MIIYNAAFPLNRLWSSWQISLIFAEKFSSAMRPISKNHDITGHVLHERLWITVIFFCLNLMIWIPKIFGFKRFQSYGSKRLMPHDIFCASNLKAWSSYMVVMWTSYRDHSIWLRLTSLVGFSHVTGVFK